LLPLVHTARCDSRLEHQHQDHRSYLCRRHGEHRNNYQLRLRRHGREPVGIPHCAVLRCNKSCVFRRRAGLLLHHCVLGRRVSFTHTRVYDVNDAYVRDTNDHGAGRLPRHALHEHLRRHALRNVVKPRLGLPGHFLLPRCACRNNDGDWTPAWLSECCDFSLVGRVGELRPIVGRG